MQRHVLLTILFFAMAATDRPASCAEISTDVSEALSQKESVSLEAINRLRNGGREAFDRLLNFRDEIRRKPASGRDIDLERLDRIIDQVGGARYSSVSRLFWHTDFEKAKAEAQAAQKPILTLRMMGKLTDEYSCANSRFFRTTLYANREVSKFLRENYILHWKSVRPVPKVTIDFGDGRKLERTLTGNSIHYVLSADGTVIDGLPGLYSPASFLAWLKEMQPAGVVFRGLDGDDLKRQARLKTWHTQKAAQIAGRWKRDLQQIETPASKPPQPQLQNQQASVPANPPARAAAKLAIPKSVVEMPILNNILAETRVLETRTADQTWEQIADRHRSEVKLDETSIRLVRAENPVVPGSGTVTDGEDPILRLVKAFEKAIAFDTVRNEYLLHGKLHRWFADGSALTDVDTLNKRVYAELFLTPQSDPWIGLVPPDAYTGLTNGGVVERK